jgi:hypothetical protein
MDSFPKPNEHLGGIQKGTIKKESQQIGRPLMFPIVGSTKLSFMMDGISRFPHDSPIKLCLPLPSKHHHPHWNKYFLYSNVWLGNYLKNCGVKWEKGKFLPLLLIRRIGDGAETDTDTHRLGIGQNYNADRCVYKYSSIHGRVTHFI